jgi:hypothetical protein
LWDARSCESGYTCDIESPTNVWGRDYVLQCLRRHSDEELDAAGLTWEEPDS